MAGKVWVLLDIQVTCHFWQICGRIKIYSKCEVSEFCRCERQVNMESLGLSHLDMVKYAENIGMNRHFKDLGVYRVSVFSVCFSCDYHILRSHPHGCVD